ncbi:hypothetical protein SynWH8103_01849 [Synechococcus sp. WH 8103]|nr:hypothetical protein SynWH8103_01849 [Synechococcus sp. WH 8103]
MSSAVVTKLSYEDPKNRSVFSNLSDLCEQIETLQDFLVFDSKRSIWTIPLNNFSCRKRHKPKLPSTQLSRKRHINSAVQLELG